MLLIIHKAYLISLSAIVDTFQRLCVVLQLLRAQLATCKETTGRHNSSFKTHLWIEQVFPVSGEAR